MKGSEGPPVGAAREMRGIQSPRASLESGAEHAFPPLLSNATQIARRFPHRMKEADTSDARDPPPHHAISSSPLWRARVVGDQLDEGAKFPLATIRLSPSVCARRPLPQRASSVFFLSSAPILAADSWT